MSSTGEGMALRFTVWNPLRACRREVTFVRGCLMNNSSRIDGLKERIRAIPIVGPGLRYLYSWATLPAKVRQILDALHLHSTTKDTVRESTYIGNYKALTRTALGQKIVLDTRDVSITPHIILDGWWEISVSRFFLNLLTEGMTVVELGANVGYYTLLAASRIGTKGKVFAFEPNPDLFEILHVNMEINGFLERTELVNKAAMHRSEPVTLHRMQRHLASASVGRPSEDLLIRWRDRVEPIIVQAISLDEFFKNRNVEINVMKIDAEGSEPYIFAGMSGTLESNPDMSIICEFNRDAITWANANPADFLENLARSGFSLMYIDYDSRPVEASIEELLDFGFCELYLKKARS